jgi:transposase
VFVKRDWLAHELRLGKSFEQIGRDVGVHGSTVAYWAKKHDLRSLGADRFSARGAPDRSNLESLAAAGATLSEMARTLDRSVATIRYWLGKWRIERIPRTDAQADRSIQCAQQDDSQLSASRPHDVSAGWTRPLPLSPLPRRERLGVAPTLEATLGSRRWRSVHALRI